MKTTNNNLQKYDVFVSYSRRDKQVVEEFCNLMNLCGISYWIDREGIGAEEFKEVIVKAIEKSRIIIFFSSKHSNASLWTPKEIGIAVECKKTIIPVKIDDSVYNNSVRFDLINLNFYDFSQLDNRKDVATSFLRGLYKALEKEDQIDDAAIDKLLTGISITDTSSVKKYIYLFAIGLLTLISIVIIKFCFFPIETNNIEKHQKEALNQLNIVFQQEKTETWQIINDKNALADDLVIKIENLLYIQNEFQKMLQNDSLTDLIKENVKHDFDSFLNSKDSIKNSIEEKANQLRLIQRESSADFYEELAVRLSK